MSVESDQDATLLGQLVDNKQLMILWGRYGAVVDTKIARLFLQADLAAACAQTGRIETPILPKWCRKYTQHLGVKTYVLVLPPRNMVATFQREMGTVSSVMVPYTVPFQVHVIQTQDEMFTRNAVFWANTDITPSLVLRRCTTPNMFDIDERKLWAPERAGKPCFGSYFSNNIGSVRGADEICQLVVDAAVNGSFNNDLNGGYAMTYLPDSVKNISIPETLLGVARSVWEANPASMCLAKMHLWRKGEELAGRNPVAEVLKIPWHQVGTLEDVLS